MVFQKKEIPCIAASVREVQNFEQTQELRLPDGFPEIGKVLCSWGQVILRGKEWRSDSFLVSGGMLMWVLYSPEDGSKPRILDGWLPFQMRWPLPADGREGQIRVSALTRFADARSVSPRKLMLRAGIGMLAEAWVPGEAEVWAPENLPDSVELLKRQTSVRLPREAGEKNFSLEEELTLGMKPETLLYYTLHPEITEQKVLADKIAFRGNGNLHVVWMGEDGAVNNQDFVLPFSQFAELKETYSSEAQVDVALCVTNLELESDEGGTLHCRCSIAAQYLVDDLQTIETVEDAYQPGVVMRAASQPLELPVIREKRIEMLPTECAAQISAVSIADICFLPDFPHLYRENEGFDIEVPGTAQILYYENDGGLRCASCRWEGKRFAKAGERTTMKALPQLSATPQFSIGGDSVTLRAELPVQLISFGGQDIPMVTSLESAPASSENGQRPSLILRRANGESLWQIAKSCSSTMAAIRNANGFTENPAPGQMLLIPVM